MYRILLIDYSKYGIGYAVINKKSNLKINKESLRNLRKELSKKRTKTKIKHKRIDKHLILKIQEKMKNPFVDGVIIFNDDTGKAYFYTFDEIKTSNGWKVVLKKLNKTLSFV